jgi:thiaminase/transcriptional activator TenA
LRQFTEDDVNNLVALNTDPDVMRFINRGVASGYLAIAETFLPDILSYYTAVRTNNLILLICIMQFSVRAWKNIENVYNTILKMPFVRELESGSLNREVFQYYMIQDAIYLGEFARVLAIISAKAPQPEIQLQFANSVREAIVVERSLHENFFREFGIQAQDALETEPSPTCLNYTNFLVAIAYQHSFAIAVAAVLPCFWIYLEVGKHIYQKANLEANPYQKWIETYIDVDFETLVNYAIQIANQEAEKASSKELALMEQVFYRASQFEWMFWDSSYRLEKWQIG